MKTSKTVISLTISSENAECLQRRALAAGTTADAIATEILHKQLERDRKDNLLIEVLGGEIPGLRELCGEHGWTLCEFVRYWAKEAVGNCEDDEENRECAREQILDWRKNGLAPTPDDDGGEPKIAVA